MPSVSLDFAGVTGIKRRLRPRSLFNARGEGCDRSASKVFHQHNKRQPIGPAPVTITD